MQAFQTSVIIIWDFLYCPFKHYVLYKKHTGGNFFHIFLVWLLSVLPRLRPWEHKCLECRREGSSIPLLIFSILNVASLCIHLKRFYPSKFQLNFTNRPKEKKKKKEGFCNQWNFPWTLHKLIFSYSCLIHCCFYFSFLTLLQYKSFSEGQKDPGSFLFYDVALK